MEPVLYIMSRCTVVLCPPEGEHPRIYFQTVKSHRLRARGSTAQRIKEIRDGASWSFNKRHHLETEIITCRLLRIFPGGGTHNWCATKAHGKGRTRNWPTVYLTSTGVQCDPEDRNLKFLNQCTSARDDHHTVVPKGCIGALIIICTFTFMRQESSNLRTL